MPYQIKLSEYHTNNQEMVFSQPDNSDMTATAVQLRQTAFELTTRSTGSKYSAAIFIAHFTKAPRFKNKPLSYRNAAPYQSRFEYTDIT